MVASKIAPELLRQTYLFDAFNDEQIEKVVKHAHNISLEARQILFNAGQKADRFYLLCAGQIKLFSISILSDKFKFGT